MIPTKEPKVSVCIASHNQGHLLREALHSVITQDYSNIELIVLDDASTDHTATIFGFSTAPGALNFYNGPIDPRIKYFRSESPSGTGGAFNKSMNYARGDYIVLLCADDIFTDPRVISDIVKIFNEKPNIAHVTRYYHQFIDGDMRPVRAWRCNDIIELANNPSGLAFRRTAITRCQLSNKMFVEASSLVACVMKNKSNYAMIMPWDTVAVRIHQSISRSKDYYKKRWVSSPVEEWTNVGGSAIQQDFTSLIQIANYFEKSAVLKECWNFIKLRPINVLDIGFWFFALVSVFTPHFILMKLPHWYRITLGRWLTKEIKRP